MNINTVLGGAIGMLFGDKSTSNQFNANNNSLCRLHCKYLLILNLNSFKTGVGLVLKELEAAGHQDDTLVIYTSDNGPPLPSGRTNLYDPGMREPMFISSPLNKKRRNQVTYAMTSLLDIVPTMLEWYNVSMNDANDIDSNSINSKNHPVLTGKSLLPLLESEPPENPDAAVYASQSYHEITMNYPMRAIRTKRYKLIHNINYRAPFPIDQDFYVSPTFQV